MRQPPKRPQRYLAGSFLRSPIPQLPPRAKPMPSPVKHIVAPHPMQAEIDACLAEIAEENGATIATRIPAPRSVPESLLDFTHPVLRFDPKHVLRFEDLHPDIRKMCATLEHLPLKPKRGRPAQGDAPKSVAQRVAESRARAQHESLTIRQMQLRADAKEKFWRDEHTAGRLTLEHMQELIDKAEGEVEQAAYEYTVERQRQRWMNSQRVTHPGYGQFMADAPEGKGLLIFDSDTVDGARGDEDAPDGMNRGRIRRVAPQGTGPDE
jgi:hypothetical protein